MAEIYKPAIPCSESHDDGAPSMRRYVNEHGKPRMYCRECYVDLPRERGVR